jgi:hypothetical protein
VDQAAIDRILNPLPGTALWRAKEFGIDLTLLAQAIQMTPAQRFERAVRTVRTATELRSARRIAD